MASIERVRESKNFGILMRLPLATAVTGVAIMTVVSSAVLVTAYVAVPTNLEKLLGNLVSADVLEKLTRLWQANLSVIGSIVVSSWILNFASLRLMQRMKSVIKQLEQVRPTSQ